jgi:hypothetical protein
MEIELTINLTPHDDGTAILTVEGPTEGVVAAYSLMMHMLQGIMDVREPEAGEEMGDSTVG